MNRDIRDILIVIGAALLALIVLFGGIQLYSGVDPPFTTVESGSMQHSEKSQIGVIDTGDIIIVRDKSQTKIQSYIDGSKTNHSMFGEYGDVIVYERMGKKPVIHRALIWIETENVPSGYRYSAPSLEGYKGKWESSNGNNPNNLGNELILYGIGYNGVEVKINLSELKSSGFITLGDNNEGRNDQNYGIINRPVSMDMIKSVAAVEIPWLGCIKMYLTNTNTNMIPMNSVYSLIAFFVVLFGVIFTIAYVWGKITKKKDEKELKNNNEENHEKEPENNDEWWK